MAKQWKKLQRADSPFTGDVTGKVNGAAVANFYHTANKPTKSDVGLANVDNDSTSTIRSGVTKTHVGLSNVTNHAAYHSGNKPTKSDVGLGSVDNESKASILGGTFTGDIGGTSAADIKTKAVAGEAAKSAVDGNAAVTMVGGSINIGSGEWTVDSNGNQVTKGTITINKDSGGDAGLTLDSGNTGTMQIMMEGANPTMDMGGSAPLGTTTHYLRRGGTGNQCRIFFTTGSTVIGGIGFANQPTANNTQLVFHYGSFYDNSSPYTVRDFTIDDDHKIGFWQNDKTFAGLTLGSDGTNKGLYVKNGGIGVGVAPADTLKFDVVGDYSNPSATAGATALAAFSAAASGSELVIGGVQSGGKVWIQNRHKTVNGYAYELALNPSGGDVNVGTHLGVGTTFSDAYLGTKSIHTVGYIDITGTGGLSFNDNSSTGYFYGSNVATISSGNNIQFKTYPGSGSYTERMRILQDGSVGIGTSVPTIPLVVNGMAGVISQLHLGPNAGLAGGGSLYIDSTSHNFTVKQYSSTASAWVSSLSIDKNSSKADFAGDVECGGSSFGSLFKFNANNYLSYRQRVCNTSSDFGEVNNGTGSFVVKVSGSTALTTASNLNTTFVGKTFTSNGNEGNPAYSFTGGNDMGMWAVDDSNIAFSSSGGKFLESDGADTTFAGLLDLNDNKGIYFGGNTHTGYQGNDSSDTLTMATGNVARLTINNTSATFSGTITASGYNDSNWNTAYTHSQASHAPTNADKTSDNECARPLTTASQTVYGSKTFKENIETDSRKVYSAAYSGGSDNYQANYGWRGIQFGNNGLNTITFGNTATGGYGEIWVNNTTDMDSDNHNSPNGLKSVMMRASGTVDFPNDPHERGWNGSSTRMKILPADFTQNDDNTTYNVAMMDNGGKIKVTHNSLEAYATYSIPMGFAAVTCYCYGSDSNNNINVYSGDIATGSTTSLGSARVNQTVNFTDLTASTTNYLIIKWTPTSTSDYLYGGYITITRL